VVVQASDRFLVGAAQAGDLHAFEALVGRHQDAVYRVALRMLGSKVDAEDAAQEALVQAWRALSTFRGESEFSTWLYRIVTNRCLKARAARHPMEALPDVLIDRDSDPAEALVQSERLHALARAVLALPAEQRAALVLRELEGLSYEQIAQALGVTVPAVKGRIHRARLGLLKASATWR
jgi:RNA polymerase sigma-70 factor, ECF subfamily